ncbi:NAD(P)-dependent oxidoreductase, partial [Pelagibacteraceae bacterium]|nr:NAD(P)-dependent oxidoreductase [Pelagibacteraceae bacterium]
LWIEMSTTDKDEMIRLSKIFKKKGGSVLECPITGGEHRATSGNISILAAGERKVFNRAFPVLSKMGHQILYCGKIGNASILKIITNYLASLNLLGIGEALAVSKKNNIDLGLTHKAINISSGNSFVNETETKVILSGSYDVGFTMDLVNKDIGLFNKLANQHNLQIDLGKILQKKFKKGLNEFGSRSFSTSIVKLIEDQGRIKMRAKNFPKELIDNFSKQKGIKV